MAILVRGGTEVSYNGITAGRCFYTYQVSWWRIFGARRLSHLRPSRGCVTRAVSGCQAIGRNLGNLGAENPRWRLQKKTVLRAKTYNSGDSLVGD